MQYAVLLMRRHIVVKLSYQAKFIIFLSDNPYSLRSTFIAIVLAHTVL